MKERWEQLFCLSKHLSLEETKNILLINGFQKSFKIINIVGTNGKGSTSKYIADGLQELGFKVGLFTSPHVHLPNERIIVNQTSISDYDFFRLEDLISGYEMNFFNHLYIVAMLYFQEHKVDYAVIEAGIGGSLDTSKSIAGDYGLVTSVALDHTKILGNTVEEIALDKSGIINPEMQFFIPTSLPKSLRKYFQKGKYFLVDNIGNNFRENNQKLASGFLKQVFGYEKLSFIEPSGRCERFTHNGLTHTMDVAHNFDGIKSSLVFLKQKNFRYEQVVFSQMAKKELEGIEDLFPELDFFVYQINDQFHSSSEFRNAIPLTNLDDFLNNLDKPTLFIGSFRLIGAIYDWKKQEDSNFHTTRE